MRKLYQLLTSLSLAFSLVSPAFGQTNATEQQVQIQAQVSFGLGLFTNTSLLNYSEPGTTTAKFRAMNTIAVPPATDDYSVNLTSLFPGIADPICFGMQDISDPGQAVEWGMAAGGSRMPMAASGFTLNRVDGTLPTLYVDNASATEYAILQISVMGN